MALLSSFRSTRKIPLDLLQLTWIRVTYYFYYFVLKRCAWCGGCWENNNQTWSGWKKCLCWKFRNNKGSSDQVDTAECLIEYFSPLFSTYSSEVPECMIILFGVSWISDTANALHDSDNRDKQDEQLLKQNQTLEEFFYNIYNFLNGDMWRQETIWLLLCIVL